MLLLIKVVKINKSSERSLMVVNDGLRIDCANQKRGKEVNTISSFMLWWKINDVVKHTT